MPATVSLDKTKFEQVPPTPSILVPLMATGHLGIRWCIMCMMPLQSARSKGSIHG